MKRFGSSILGACLALAWAGLAPQALAAESMEEMVVTATKRDQTVADVPFSINAMSEEDIQRLGINNIEELANNVAGLSIQNLGPGQSQVSVRGLSAGQIIRDQPGVKEQVGIYLDESPVSLSLFTPDFDLYDLNRVEVLRGPQGTLFGAGSVGGTIRYITSQPILDETSGSIEVDANSVADGEAAGHVKGAFNVPVGENAAMRLVGYSTEFAGYVDAYGRDAEGKLTKTEDVNSGSRRGGRIAVKWQPEDYFTVTPRLVFQKLETDGFNRQEPFNVFANEHLDEPVALDHREQYLLVDESFTDESFLFDVVLEVNFDIFDFTSITSILDREILVSRDASALTGSVSIDTFQMQVFNTKKTVYEGNGTLTLAEDRYGLPSNLRDTTEIRQFTQELRISSNTDSAIQWVAGVFMSETDREYAQRLPTPGYDQLTIDGTATRGGGDMGPDAGGGPINPEELRNGFADLDSPYNADVPYELSQLAAFAEISRDFDDRLNVTAGWRWYRFEEDRTFKSGGMFSNRSDERDKTDSTGISPRIIASLRMSDALTWNAQASKGFRLGGVNDPLNETLCKDSDIDNFGGFQSYEDETSWNYETGFKANWSRASLNMAFFRTDIRDLQVTLDAGTCSSRISFNVADAHSVGFEFELTAEPREGLSIGLAGSLLESEFDSDVMDSDGNILAGIEDGNRLASVPKFQLAASLNYIWPVRVFGGADAYIAASIQHISDRLTQPSDQVNDGVYNSGLAYGGATGMENTILDLELNSYTIANLRFGYLTSSWETAIYVNNATDEMAFLSFDRERDGRARLGFRTNQPRTVGLLFRKYFQ